MSNVLDLILKKLKGHMRRKISGDTLTEVFRTKYNHFKAILDSNAELSKIISELEDKLQGDEVFGMTYIKSQCARAVFHAMRMIGNFDTLSNGKFPALFDVLERLNVEIRIELEDLREESSACGWVLPYSNITKEMVDLVGGKNANLGEIQSRLNLPVPGGFAITTAAYRFFLAENDLTDQIEMKKIALDPNDPESVNSTSEEIQRLIISAPIPEKLQKELLIGYDAIAGPATRAQDPEGRPRISMRSSAVGEDSELSFAGQYLSVLNVPHEKILMTYKYVIASLFTPRAISYRLLKGIPDKHCAMSVGCITMIDSIASGVIYSRHPFDPGNENILISAVWGLGPYAVEGAITPDSYTVSRKREILEKNIAVKAVKLVSNPGGGLREETVSEINRQRACLSDPQIATLAGYALKLEEHSGSPQDIEWALDPDENLFILQSRQLGGGYKTWVNAPQTIAVDQSPLLEAGLAAFPGVGCGKAHKVTSEDDLLTFPEGGVLVAVQPSPKYMVIMPKARAIVTDFGSVTGHMASLAREFSIPTLLDTKKATSVIADGTEITVDAFSGKVYQGIIPQLLELQRKRKSSLKGTPVYETLKRVAATITPLRLVDPQSPEFVPENCRSIQDLMRFVHELCYSEMFKIGDLVSGAEGFAIKLIAPIPLDLHLIDLGGGISQGAANCRKIKPDQITSVPLKALLKGLLNEELRTFSPRPIELKGFLSVMGEQMLNPHLQSERFGERSYAIISDKYLNFSSRVGYHYGVLDSYCGASLAKNYITFSFKGGAADESRRNRRARVIALILESFGMKVEVTADRVDARAQKLEASILAEKLDIIGRLFQFTRQLDMLMTDENMVGAVAKSFLDRRYNL
ncbi:MAG TPA: phosphoenolpyruvate synthase [Deltaproteobacteria bacterium]|jgi:pyruvate,water dikinase|nr:phosphoenolpyruvate synthase [Deltaproteobacteria bacterium]